MLVSIVAIISITIMSVAAMFSIIYINKRND